MVIPEPWEKRGDTDVTFVAEHSTDNCPFALWLVMSLHQTPSTAQRNFPDEILEHYPMGRVYILRI